MEKLNKIFYAVFEKYGWFKLTISAILSIFFLWLNDKTGTQFWLYAATPFLVYSAAMILILFIFAWIINPINNLKEKRKENK